MGSNKVTVSHTNSKWVEERAGRRSIGSEGLKRVCEPIRAALEDVGRRVSRWLEPPTPELTDVFGGLQASQGKLIRPALLLLAGRLVGGLTGEHVAVATAVELLHTASLIHDDIVDDDQLRRGTLSIRARWGASEAMLVGDVVFGRALEVARRTESPAVTRLLLAAARAVSEAELLHTHRRGDLGLSAKEYLQIARAKTASLFGLAAGLGAMLSDGGGSARRRLRQYGRALGLAYQLADDCRDVTTDPTPGGAGLARGCVTLPLIYHLEYCDEAEREWAAGVLRSGDERQRADLGRRIVASGACRRVRETAADWLGRARRALAPLPQGSAKAALEEAAAYVLSTFDENAL